MLFSQITDSPLVVKYSENALLLVPSRIRQRMLTPAFSGKNRAMTTGNKPSRNHRTVMREEYVKIAERGFGQLQGFVSKLSNISSIVFYSYTMFISFQ
jgi:hypothetical protein